MLLYLQVNTGRSTGYLAVISTEQTSSVQTWNISFASERAESSCNVTKAIKGVCVCFLIPVWNEPVVQQWLKTKINDCSSFDLFDAIQAGNRVIDLTALASQRRYGFGSLGKYFSDETMERSGSP